MRVSLLCSVVSVFLVSAAFAQGEGEFPATLKGHAVLPAQTFQRLGVGRIPLGRLPRVRQPQLVKQHLA